MRSRASRLCVPLETAKGCGFATSPPNPPREVEVRPSFLRILFRRQRILGLISHLEADESYEGVARTRRCARPLHSKAEEGEHP